MSDFKIDSKSMALSIEAIAKEIAAAAHLYDRMASGQNSLAAGLTALKARLDGAYDAFARLRAEEGSHAPR